MTKDFYKSFLVRRISAMMENAAKISYTGQF
jgi:hypothetical protein